MVPALAGERNGFDANPITQPPAKDLLPAPARRRRRGWRRTGLHPLSERFRERRISRPRSPSLGRAASHPWKESPSDPGAAPEADLTSRCSQEPPRVQSGRILASLARCSVAPVAGPCARETAQQPGGGSGASSGPSPVCWQSKRGARDAWGLVAPSVGCGSGTEKHHRRPESPRGAQCFIEKTRGDVP